VVVFAANGTGTKGYKDLVLERGPMIELVNYPTAMLDKWDLPNQGKK